jgi:ABC-type transport system substrate-binding protein
MPASDPRQPTRRDVTRRQFLKRAGVTGAGMTALVVDGGRRRASASLAYPDWIPPSAKLPKRGGVLKRASAWDPPMIDPRLTQSVGLFQFAGLVHNRLLRYSFSDEANGYNDLSLKGDLAEAWQGSPDQRVWTFKLRRGVKWQNVAPLNGRELVAADVKYCFEQYAKEGVQAFTFQEIEGMETPDAHTLRVHLKTPNALFPQNVAEPVAVIFSERGPRGGRRSQEAHDRHRPVHSQGAHPQGAAGAAAQPPLLRRRPPLRGRVHSPLDAGLRHPHGGVPHGSE